MNDAFEWIGAVFIIQCTFRKDDWVAKDEIWFSCCGPPRNGKLCQDRAVWTSARFRQGHRLFYGRYQLNIEPQAANEPAPALLCNSEKE